MEPIITVNDYPIGWEWLANVPLEDFNWLIDIFATMTDNTDTYDFVFYEDSETLPGPLKRICSKAHKHTHPTNKIRYIISQLIILTLYTSSLILVSYTYRIILRYI